MLFNYFHLFFDVTCYIADGEDVDGDGVLD